MKNLICRFFANSTGNGRSSGLGLLSQATSSPPVRSTSRSSAPLTAMSSSMTRSTPQPGVNSRTRSATGSVVTGNFTAACAPGGGGTVRSVRVIEGQVCA